MNSRWRGTGLVTLLVVLTVGVLIGMNLFQPVFGVAQQQKSNVQPRYHVVHTEGTNLIITDNQRATLYFYTIDKDAQPGADLNLRASVDLTQTGKNVLKPKLFQKK